MNIRKTMETAWDAVMDEERNPLRHFPLMTAHMLMQILAWMWSIVFSLALGSYFVFGVTVVGHVLIIAAVFVTLAIFRDAERQSAAEV